MNFETPKAKDLAALKDVAFPVTIDYSNWGWCSATSLHPRKAQSLFQWLLQNRRKELVKALGSYCTGRVDEKDIECNSHLKPEDVGTTKSFIDVNHDAYRFKILDETTIVVYAGTTADPDRVMRAPTNNFRFVQQYKGWAREEEDEMRVTLTVPATVLAPFIAAHKKSLVEGLLAKLSRRRQRIQTRWDDRKSNRKYKQHLEQLMEQVWQN